MQLIDTHCHIHEADYPLDVTETMRQAADAGVLKMICVGTSEQSSREAISFAENRTGVFAAVGVHPHDTKDGYTAIAQLANENVVAVGEIGLDYFYTHSPRDIQINALEFQIQAALDNSLPIIFHVRDAFDDFWPIFDNFSGIKGVLHSFTDSQDNIGKAFARGLYVGVNGISTFTKDPLQHQLFSRIPLDRMLLETDSPFLTPTPYRGNINQPAYVSEVARHHATIRGINPEEVAAETTANANLLFDLS